MFLVTAKTLDQFVDKMYGSFASDDGRAARNRHREERLNLRREEERQQRELEERLERQQREREERLERARRWLVRRLDVEVDGNRGMRIRDFLNQIHYHPAYFSMDDFIAFAGAGAYI